MSIIVRKITLDDTDAIIRTYHHNLHNKEEKPLLEGLTAEEKKKFVAAERELKGEGEKRQLEEAADAEAEVPAAKKTRTETVA